MQWFVLAAGRGGKQRTRENRRASRRSDEQPATGNRQRTTFEETLVMYTKMLSLRFPPSAVNEPVITNLIRKFDLECNILKAVIYPRKEGLAVMEVSGHRKNYHKGLHYLRSIGIKVESIAEDIKRDDEKCYQCGACTAVCPTGALYIERPAMKVIFEKDKCSACELCVAACPARAMEVKFNKSLLD
jgi:L-aspartate semialdehyde sulfurtransferase ferredoxin